MKDREKFESYVEISKNLNDGNLNTPIKISGVGYHREILENFESLRQQMLVLQNKQKEIIESNQLSVANLTHDMKTPLALIAGYAESIQDGINDKDYLSLILDKTTYMNELVLKIIESSKQQIESINEKKEKVKACEFFNKEVQKYKKLADTKNIKIRYKNLVDATVFIDKKEFSSVIQNLVSNAIKFGRHDGKIEIVYRKKGNYLSVLVKDNGFGIEKEKLPFVFDKFFMGDNSRSTANSGLGLFIVKNIIENNGGNITVKSKPYKGSAFTFFIPLFSDIKKKDEVDDFIDNFKSISKKPNENVFMYFARLILIMPFLICYTLTITALVLLFVSIIAMFWFLDIILIIGTFFTAYYSLYIFINIGNLYAGFLYLSGTFFAAGLFILLGNNLIPITTGIFKKIKIAFDRIGSAFKLSQKRGRNL